MPVDPNLYNKIAEGIIEYIHNLESHYLGHDQEAALTPFLNAEIINHIITEGPKRGESVAFWLANLQDTNQHLLLNKNDFALGKLITPASLNHVIEDGALKGQSVAYRLSCEFLEETILSINDSLWLHITPNTLNSITTTGSSLAFELFNETLIHIYSANDYALAKQISAATVNYIEPGNNLSVPFFLASYNDLTFILKLNDYALARAINAVTLNTFCYDENESVALELSKSEEGLEILSADNYALALKISEETLNATQEQESVASNLAKTAKGREILKAHDYALAKKLRWETVRDFPHNELIHAIMNGEDFNLMKIQASANPTCVLKVFQLNLAILERLINNNDHLGYFYICLLFLENSASQNNWPFVAASIESALKLFLRTHCTTTIPQQLKPALLCGLPPNLVNILTADAGIPLDAVANICRVILDAPELHQTQHLAFILHTLHARASLERGDAAAKTLMTPMFARFFSKYDVSKDVVNFAGGEMLFSHVASLQDAQEVGTVMHEMLTQVEDGDNNKRARITPLSTSN